MSDPLIPTRRRRFVSVTRTYHPDGLSYTLDAICEEGRAWWRESKDRFWSATAPLPKIDA